MSQMGGVSQSDIKREQLTQQRFALRGAIASQARLEAVALPLLKAALPLCHDRVTLRSGINMASIHAYDKEWREAAAAEGLTDTVTITNVVKGSAAERAGLRAGDRVVAIDGEPIEPGKSALQEMGKRLAARFTPTKASAALARDAAISAPVSLEFPASTLPLTVHRDSSAMDIVVPPDTACAYGVVVVKNDQLNAFADGNQVYITSAMMRFAADDDALAVVVSHEIGHNAMRHMDAKRRNSMIGAFFGALVDVAMATQGINTQGSYTSQMADLGAMTFSQDFEREADYTGMALLARTGRNMDAAPLLWRQMAAESPGSIKFASSHPTTAERFVRLEEWKKEFEAKKAAGEPLLPTMKGK
jgi:membrane-associated protease RseP (regulator of RpoE activity)